MHIQPPLPSTVLRYGDAVGQVGRAALRAHVRAGRWQNPAPGVYVTHNGPLSASERTEVALAACTPRAALGGLSALRLDGFEGFAPERPLVVLPVGIATPVYGDVQPHWSTYLDARDVHPLHTPRRTRPARSLIDAASWAGSDDRARAIVIAGVQQGLCTTRMLRDALSRRGTCHRRALVVESILDAHGGIQSLPERSFDEIRTRFHLPRPSRQSRVRGAGGRYYLDVEWQEYSTSVEIHGIPHLRIVNWEKDLERANEIVIAGKRLVIFSSYAVRRHQDRVGDQTLRMLVSGGFVPTKDEALCPPGGRRTSSFVRDGQAQVSA